MMLDLAGQHRFGHVVRSDGEGAWCVGDGSLSGFGGPPPRIERSKRHGLLDIITIAICGVICGADSWVFVEMFGKSKEEWFRFQECFMEWSQAVADLLPGEVVAIDGKTVRRSHDKRASRQAIHLVSAWAAANTLTLGQVKTDQKSNEITAIPRLLNCLS